MAYFKLIIGLKCLCITLTSEWVSECERVQVSGHENFAFSALKTVADDNKIKPIILLFDSVYEWELMLFYWLKFVSTRSMVKCGWGASVHISYLR